jgi:hypothetical protein
MHVATKQLSGPALQTISSEHSGNNRGVEHAQTAECAEFLICRVSLLGTAPSKHLPTSCTPVASGLESANSCETLIENEYQQATKLRDPVVMGDRP